MFFNCTVSKIRLFSNQLPLAPCSLQVITWPPGVKTKDKNGKVTHHQPLPSQSAKDLFQSGLTNDNQRIEIMGHAAAKFHINLQDDNLNSQFKSHILQMLHNKSIATDKLEKISSYISWYPERDITTGKMIEFNGKLTGLLGDLEEKLGSSKNNEKATRLICEFLSAEMRAINSNWEYDVEMYGNPSDDRIITLTGDMDYQAVFLKILDMMQPSISKDNKTLLLTQPVYNATYFGMDILRLFIHFFNSPKDFDKEKIIEFMHPNHVCTTAVLRLMIAAIGDEVCQKIGKKVVIQNPKLTTAGLPLVDFTHYFTQAVARQYSPVSGINNPLIPRM